MSTERDIQLYIDCVKAYFAQFGAPGEVEFSTPHVLGASESLHEFLDYTGTVGVVGNYRGAIYVTASRQMLADITREILGSDPSDEDLVDVIGEVANTIGGSAKQHFGRDYNITPPVVISGSPHSVQLPKLTAPVYVVPFRWRGAKSFLYIGLDRN